MNGKKFCLAILASSLLLYVVIATLVRTNYVQLGSANWATQFMQDGSTRRDNGGIIQFSSDTPPVLVNTHVVFGRVFPPRRGLAGLVHDSKPFTENRFKYNISLPPDSYAINRPAESQKSIAPALDRKSITQLELKATIADQLGAAVKRFPTTLIIGVRKAGTRALLASLKLHPQVKSCGPEVHYFDQRYPRGLQWYVNQTPEVRTGQITIEKTPSYFVVQNVPQRILEYTKTINKTLKFLVIFRDPTVRAVSDYVQISLGVQAKYQKLLKPFEKLVMKNSSAFEINTEWSLIKTGVYSKHLQRWLRYFPLEWFHFVSGEELTSNPYEEVKKVEKFLELKPYFTNANFVFNAEKGFPCFRGSTSKNERCLGKTKGRPHPPVDPRVLSELRRYYGPFNEQLYKMVGRDFQWPRS